MLKIHEMDKLPEFSYFFVNKGSHVELSKLVHMLFLLDLIHYFEIGRPATNLTYWVKINNVAISLEKENELASLLLKDSPPEATMVAKDPAIFAKKVDSKLYLKKFTKRELRILKKIVSEWDSAMPVEILTSLSKTYNIITNNEGSISFKETLINTDKNVFLELKDIIEENEEFDLNFKKHFSHEPTPDDGLKKCNQVK